MRWILLLVAVAGAQELVKPQDGRADQDSRRKPQIVFVCDHGAALSVVSAAYFNKMARERHLDLHAIARGTTPQKDISVTAREGLKADGVAVETKQPQALSARDVARAQRIVAFCPIPAKYSKKVPVENWSEVPWTPESYGVARDAILKRLEELIKNLQAQ